MKYKNTVYRRNNHILEHTVQRFSNENLCFIDTILSGREYLSFLSCSLCFCQHHKGLLSQTKLAWLVPSVDFVLSNWLAWT